MEHLILLVYALLYSSGFAGIAVLVFLRLRFRSAMVGAFLTLQILLLVGLGLTTVVFYTENVLSAIAGPGGAGALVPVKTLMFIIGAGLYVVAFRATRLLRRAAPGKKRRQGVLLSVVAGLCIVVAALNLASILLLLLGGSSPWLIKANPAFSAAGYGITGLTIFLFALALLRDPLPGQQAAVRLLIRGYGISLLAFTPLTLLEYLLGFAGTQPYQPLSLDFLFFYDYRVE